LFQRGYISNDADRAAVGFDRRVRLADALDTLPSYPATKVDEPPPWNGKAAGDAPAQMRDAAVAA
jgi:hypothetical protein